MTDAAGRRARRLLAWSVLAGCFLLGFFHRFAPATFADALSTDLDVTDAQLGALASWHFWTYTVAQIPAGLLVDRHGTRRCVAVGSTVTAAGALLLAVAQNLVTASAGPLLTGAGLSVVFVGIMKFNAAWFSPERYGLVTGVTMLLATCGAVAAGSPTAWLLEHFPWRGLFAVAAAAGLALSLAVAALVRNHPAGSASAPVSGAARGGLRDAFRSRALWPLLLATAGTNGTFYAFSGLWGVPLLTDTRGLSNTAAAWYTTAALTVYGIGCLAIGVWSDRAGRRKPFILGTSAMALTGWACLALLPWDAGWQGLALYALVGAAASQVTVSFAALKEAVPAHIAATALAILNAGCFGVSAALQPLFGLVLDAELGWDRALALMAGTSALGLLAARASRETWCRPVAPADSPAAPETAVKR